MAINQKNAAADANNMLSKLYQIFKDGIVPVLVALLPFGQNIIDFFTQPEHQFVYERSYKKNPIEDWNRSVEKFLVRLDPDELKETIPPPPLLRAIGKEIRQSLPAMLAGFGAKPFDEYRILIFNQSNKDLVNVRINLFNCKGHYEVSTVPDTSGSIPNALMRKLGENDALTVKYGSMPRHGISNHYTQITYYGMDASSCTVTIDADLDKGGAAKGLFVEKVDKHITDGFYKTQSLERGFDIAWKLLMSGVIIYLFFLLRRLRGKRNTRNRAAREVVSR